MQRTYLEILSEQDTESRSEYVNPKDLFVDHNRYDDIESEDDEGELEKQEDFQKFGGSHQQSSSLIVNHTTQSTHTNSLPYAKSVKINILSIDSRFRTNRIDHIFNFLYKISNPIKNVVSVRLSSIEIPNTWYTFSEYKGNTSFDIIISGNSYTITISDGNYSLDTNLDNCLQTHLQQKINSIITGQNFVVSFNTITSLLSISNSLEFQLDFTKGIFNSRTDNWGLGYNLGFRDQSFTTTTKITELSKIQSGLAIPDIIGSNYIFVSLNPDWRNVEHKHPDHNNSSAFAKIVVDVNKNDIIYDGSNLITKTFTLKQPTNISSFNITLFDEYGQYILLMGGDVSLTLEVTEVTDSALYETLRN
jgi:hypothetical protein